MLLYTVSGMIVGGQASVTMECGHRLVSETLVPSEGLLESKYRRLQLIDVNIAVKMRFAVTPMCDKHCWLVRSVKSVRSIR